MLERVFVAMILGAGVAMGSAQVADLAPGTLTDAFRTSEPVPEATVAPPPPAPVVQSVPVSPVVAPPVVPAAPSATPPRAPSRSSAASAERRAPVDDAPARAGSASRSNPGSGGGSRGSGPGGESRASAGGGSSSAGSGQKSSPPKKSNDVDVCVGRLACVGVGLG